MKLKTVTLGCKVNQYETQYVREGLLGIGFQDADEHQPADLCIVNTCTVTAEGDSKSRQIIRRLARENPASRIVVMGCYATRAPQDVASLPNVTEVVTDKRELPDLLGRFGVTDVPTGISGFGRRHRAYVKVQDGCLLRCSFCIIPYVRPQLASRPIEQIENEVRRLVDNGFREVVLTGIHLGHYGVEWNRRTPKAKWTRLSHLVRRLAELPGDFRIRLSSIEATEVTRELIAVMADYPAKVCPHLHISMQSGSDAVLRRMRRRWGARRFVDRCGLRKDRLDRPAITTDVIVGFPGETEAEFAETVAVCREVGFSKIHIFPFSPRRGTPAADMPGQLPKRIQQDRGRELAQAEAELRDAYFAELCGMPLRVLVESPLDQIGAAARSPVPSKEGARGGIRAPVCVGASCRYAPVEVSCTQSQLGDLIDVIAGPARDGRISAAEQPPSAATPAR
ncbi:MAG: tRNA (N(6)-L-threonylcarbamoyladenosine(37)-C(2))-methylthiotransferase MtaB [Pirellulales bacterium]|nr:tRNA (N(6)-L-threonylcarbamoyladenosine(37)-C(2))-methylthiotransferase MtaB [Pirellulales bacterium]